MVGRSHKDDMAAKGEEWREKDESEEKSMRNEVIWSVRIIKINRRKEVR